MSRQVANLVWETSTTTGTGNLTTARNGGYQRGSEAFGTGDDGSDNPYIFIVNVGASGAEWEICPGYWSDANTLVRGTTLLSSNSNNAVNFGAGTKNITNDIPAAFQRDASGNLTPWVSDGGALGTSSLPWSDLFLANGAVINFNASEVTITHSTNTIAFAGTTSGFLIGGTAALNTAVDGVAVTPQFQIQSTGAAASGVMMRFSNDTAAPAMYMVKSRGTTIGSYTIVNDGDQLGRLSFAASDGTDAAEAGRIDCVASGTIASNVMPGKVRVRTTPPSSQTPTTKFEVGPTGACLAVAATGSIGYGTGAGGSQTQSTSKSTTVQIDRPTGQITMNNATLNANTTVSFTFTNSTIAAGDQLVLNHISGGTAGSYLLNAQCGAGSATVNVRNITAGNLGEAIVIAYSLIKGVTS